MEAQEKSHASDMRVIADTATLEKTEMMKTDERTVQVGGGQCSSALIVVRVRGGMTHMDVLWACRTS